MIIYKVKADKQENETVSKLEVRYRVVLRYVFTDHKGWSVYQAI